MTQNLIVLGQRQRDVPAGILEPHHRCPAQPGLSLTGQHFDFVLGWMWALAAAQHRTNRQGNALADLLDGSKLESVRRFEISHNLQTHGSSRLPPELFDGGHDDIPEAE